MTEPPGGTEGSRARRAPGEEEAVGSWFELVAPRTLVDRSPRIRLPLSLGDEVFVAAGDSVQPGLLLGCLETLLDRPAQSDDRHQFRQ